VEVNPADGSFGILKEIPGVNWVTTIPDYISMDNNHSRYFFKGADSSYDWKLYAIDSHTGTVLSNPPFCPSCSQLDNLIEFEYDENSDTLYALHWNNALQREYFVAVDPATGDFQIISELPDVNYIQVESSTFDVIHNQYIFLGFNFDGTEHLYTIDASTGAVLYSPPFTAFINILDFEFDRNNGNIYALLLSNIGDHLQLVSINNQTLNYQAICTINNAEGVTSGFTTFDSNHERYIFCGPDLPDGIYRLYSVDVNSAQVISQPPFYLLPEPISNIIETQYDAGNDKLVALHWDNHWTDEDSADFIPPDTTHDTTGTNDTTSFPVAITIYPNPFNDELVIEFASVNHPAVSFALYNEVGQLIIDAKQISTRKLVISKISFTGGIYFYKLYSGKSVFKSGELVLQR